MAGLKFDITGDNSNMLSALQGTQNGVRQTQKVVEESGQSIEQMFGRVQTAAAASLGAFSAKEFASKVMSIRGEFQQLEVAFSTMLGSASEANALMNQLVRTAATTPFDLKGVADGAKQLLAYGTSAKDVNETLVRLGDIAAGLSIPLGDLVYLYGTTMVQGRMFTMDLRQFQGRGIPLAEELAKQFGVAKEEVAGLVTQGKVSAEVFNKAIVSMTSSGGKFAGLMENQSHTITGQISNIEDAIDMMFNDFGKESEGVINKGLEVTSFLVEHWRQVGEAIMGAVGTIGLYKAALGTVAVVNELTTSYQYQVEATELQKLVAVKEENVSVDLQSAVASGRLSAAKAQEIASIRLEVQSKIQAAQATLAQAQADEMSARKSSIAATQRYLTAKQNLSIAQSQVAIAVKSGTAEEIEIAKKSAHTAAEELNTAAIARNNASKNLSVATSTRRGAAQSVETLQTGVNTAAQNANAVSTGFLAAAKQRLTVAVSALNGTMLASPWFWAAAAVVGLVYATYKLVTAETAEEEARRKANNAMDEFNQKVDKQRQKVQDLIGVVQSSTATELQKADAYAQLKTLVPSLTEKYSQQALAQADVNKANKEFNEQADQMKYDEIQKNISDTTEKLDSLKKEFENYSQQPQDIGTAAAMAMISREIDKQQALLEQYYSQLTQYNAAKQQALENSKPLEIRIEEANENKKVQQSIFDFYDRAVKASQDAADNTVSVMRDAGQNSTYVLNNLIEELSQKIEKLKDDERKNPLVIHPELQGMQAALNDLVSMKDEWKTSGKTTIPLFFRLNYQSAQQSLKDAKDKAQSLISQHPSADNNLKHDREAARKKYNEDKALLDKINKNQSKYTKEQYKEAEVNLKASTQAYEDLGGKIDKPSKNAAEKAARERLQASRDHAKYIEFLKNQKEERKRVEIDLEFSTRQAILKAMGEGSKKTLEQLAFDRDKQIEEIERNYKEIKQKKIEAARQVFEANPANKKRVFRYNENDKRFGYTAKEQENYRANKSAVETEYERGVKEQLQSELQSLYDYLKEYGTIQQQMYAIAKEYDEKIAKEKDENRKKILQKEKESALAKTNSNSLAMDIDWGATFGGIGKVLKDIAKDTLKEVEQYMRSAEFKSLSPSDKKAYTDLRDKLRSEGAGEITSPFNFSQWSEIERQTRAYQDSVRNLKEKTKAHAKAVDDLRTAEKLLETATTDTTRKIAQAMVDSARGKVESTAVDLNNAKEDQDNKKSDLTDSTSKAVQGLDNFSSALRTMSNGTLKGFADGLANLIKSIGGKGGTGGIIGAIGGKAGGLIGAILQIIDALGDDPAGFIKGILDRVGKVVETILAELPKLIGSILEGVWNIITGIVSGIGSLFTGGGNEKSMEREIDKLTKSNERLAQSIDELSKNITKKDNTNEQSIEAYKKALKEEEDWEANQRSAIDKRASEHGRHHSFNANASDSSWHVWREFNDVLQKIGSNAMVYRAEDVWKLSPEEMKELRSQALPAWREMFDNNGGQKSPEDLVNAYIERSGKRDELAALLNEKLTGYSWDGFMDSYKSVLKNLESTTEDFSNNINEMISNALLESFANEELKPKIKELYDYIAKAAEDGLDDGEIAYIRKTNEDIANQGIEKRNILEQAGLIKKKGDEEQNATANGVSSITFEQANNIVALTTAGNISRDQIKDLAASVMTTISSMAFFSSSTNTAVLEIRNLMIYNNSYLEDILKCSKSIYTDFSRKIDDVNKNLKDLK